MSSSSNTSTLSTEGEDFESFFLTLVAPPNHLPRSDSSLKHGILSHESMSPHQRRLSGLPKLDTTAPVRPFPIMTLPAEIRIKIWKLIALQPRRIMIHTDELLRFRFPKIFYDGRDASFSKKSDLFRICYEARQVIKPSQLLIAERRSSSNPCELHSPLSPHPRIWRHQPLWVDFGTDIFTLDLTKVYSFSAFPLHHYSLEWCYLSRIQHLEITYDQKLIKSKELRRLDILNYTPSLSSVTFLVDMHKWVVWMRYRTHGRFSDLEDHFDDHLMTMNNLKLLRNELIKTIVKPSSRRSGILSHVDIRVRAMDNRPLKLDGFSTKDFPQQITSKEHKTIEIKPQRNFSPIQVSAIADWKVTFDQWMRKRNLLEEIIKEGLKIQAKAAERAARSKEEEELKKKGWWSVTTYWTESDWRAQFRRQEKDAERERRFNQRLRCDGPRW